MSEESVEHYNRKASEASEALDALVEETRSLRNERDALIHRLDDVFADNANLMEKCVDLTRRCRKLEEGNAGLRAEIAVMKGRRAILQKENTELRAGRTGRPDPEQEGDRLTVDDLNAAPVGSVVNTALFPGGITKRDDGKWRETGYSMSVSSALLSTMDGATLAHPGDDFPYCDTARQGDPLRAELEAIRGNIESILAVDASCLLAAVEAVLDITTDDSAMGPWDDGYQSALGDVREAIREAMSDE